MPSSTSRPAHREQFGRELPLASLFRAGTIENLAALLRREGEAPSRSALVEITPPALPSGSVGGGERRPFFCVHPAGGNVLCYAELASMIPQAGSAYAYSYATLGELVAWIIGWDLILEYALGAATVAVGWSGHLTSFLHDFVHVEFPAVLSAAPGTLVHTAAGDVTAIFMRPIRSG